MKHQAKSLRPQKGLLARLSAKLTSMLRRWRTSGRLTDPPFTERELANRTEGYFEGLRQAKRHFEQTGYLPKNMPSPWGIGPTSSAASSPKEGQPSTPSTPTES